MNKAEFDCLIKENLIKENKIDAFGYRINDNEINRNYLNYYDKETFKEYVESLPEDVRTKYSRGKGGELEEKNSYPPKMASVASSSRFCVEAIAKADKVDLEEVFKLKEIMNIDVEHGVKFRNGGTAPQLDAYISDGEAAVYVECKCHEIFDSHKVSLKKSYNDASALMNEKICVDLNNTLGVTSNASEYVFDINKVFGIVQKPLRFDIGQAIRHIIGIRLTNKDKAVRKRLVFLFFKPVFEGPQKNELNHIYEDLEDQIRCFVRSEFVKNLLKTDLEVEFAYQESSTMTALDLNNYRRIDI